MVRIEIYEQESWGRVRYRVGRIDGHFIFDRHFTDFDTEEDAVSCTLGEIRRKELGPYKITIYRMDRQTNGRRKLFRVIAG